MQHPRHRTGVILASIALVVTAVLPGSPFVAQQAQAASVSRLAGANRYATAVEISKSQFAPGVRVAYVSTGDNFPDALAGGPLAAASGGPMLLLRRSEIPDVVRAELRRLKPQRIVILGGPSSVSASVGAALGAYTAGSVTRLQGADRYETAVKVSRAGFGPGVSAVYVATGENFPDALAASAAAARNAFPVLLVRAGSLPASVRAELDRLQPKKILVAGGTAAVSEAVRAELARFTTGAVERVAGSDRYATAAAISKKHYGSATQAYVATGLNYPDALAAAPVAGMRDAPVLLTSPQTVPQSTRGELSRLKPDRVLIVGGTATVSTSVGSTIASLISPPSSSGSRCAIPMPSSAPAGWTRKVTSTFSETTPLGQWPGPVAGASWRSRTAGAKDSSGRGTYDSSKTVSEANGLLDVWIHSEVPSRPRVHDPAGQRYVAALLPRIGATKGARISICMRADVIPGYKLAYLLWPSEGPGNYHGEIDFPELRLVGLPATPKAFMHYAPKPSSGKAQDYYETGAAVQQWHAYTIEWNPKAATPYAKFYLDGRLIGTSTKYVPTITMQYIMQMETFVSGQDLPAPAQGHIQVDWITIDLP
jgi:putative cell wall-binding protein